MLKKQRQNQQFEKHRTTIEINFVELKYHKISVYKIPSYFLDKILKKKSLSYLKDFY